jgi:hypothetical protein
MIEVTPGLLRAAMFGWEELWGEPCLTQVRQDSFSPKRTPLDVAKVLHKHDPEERLFKIFFFPGHAEVWHADHWHASASRQAYLCSQAAARSTVFAERAARQKEEFDRLTNIKNSLLELMPAFEHNPRGLHELARVIDKAPDAFFERFPSLRVYKL